MSLLPLPTRPPRSAITAELGAKLLELRALVGRQDGHDLLVALLTIGHALANLGNLLLLRVGQAKLGEKLLHPLPALAVSATV